MEVAIVKYPAGNVASLRYALERLGVKPFLSDDPKALAAADKVIFPGQGAAGPAMEALREKGLDKVLKNLEQPFLGICLGLQLMAEHSEEMDTRCLGLYPTSVLRFPKQDQLKIPHMAWNKLLDLKEDPLLEGLGTDSWFYFVHSYYMPVFAQSLAACRYGETFTAVVGHDNFYAAQFHPEKSGQDGERLLKNFLYGL